GGGTAGPPALPSVGDGRPPGRRSGMVGSLAGRPAPAFDGAGAAAPDRLGGRPRRFGARPRRAPLRVAGGAGPGPGDARRRVGHGSGGGESPRRWGGVGSPLVGGDAGRTDTALVRLRLRVGSRRRLVGRPGLFRTRRAACPW